MELEKLHLFYRQSTYKGKVYRSYSLARAFRDDGKNKREIVLKLGKLDDEQVSFWKSVLSAAKKEKAFFCESQDVKVTSNKSYLDVAVAHKIWDWWKFDSVFPAPGRKKVDVAKLAEILTINRNVNPTSKSAVPKWFESTMLPEILDTSTNHINASRIYRELETIEDCKNELSSLIFSKIRRENPESLKLVFYDLSSSRFYGNKCSIVKYGHCKEGYEQHVVLALLINKDGLPFFWEVLPGATSDIKTITLLMDNVREKFSSIQTTLVFDRGFVSTANLSKLEAKKVKYISALDKPQIENNCDFDFKSISGFSPDDNDFYLRFQRILKKFDHNTRFTEAGLNSENRRCILVFNKGIYDRAQKARTNSLNEFKGYIAEMNSLLKSARNDRDRSKTYRKFREKAVKLGIIDFADVTLKETTSKYKNDYDEIVIARTYAAKLEYDEAKKNHSGRLDGFWMLITNLVDRDGSNYVTSPEEIIQAYRDKYIIEDSFRDIKSFVEIAPVYLWTEKHIKAHYTICILSHLINRTLALLLRKKPGTLSRDFKTADSVFCELSKCMVNDIQIEGPGLSFRTITKPSIISKELLARIDALELISAKNLNNIKTLPNS